jgi:cyclopropane-fatty-acyl-phospholipid synthase
MEFEPESPAIGQKMRVCEERDQDMMSISQNPPKSSLPGRRARLSELVLKTAMTRIIRNGTLTLRLPDGRTLSFGGGEPVVAATIRDWRTLRRLAFNPDLALGEAYMDGTLIVTKGEIYDFLALCLANIGLGRDHWLRRMQQRLRWLGRRFMMYNPIGRAQKNVAHHYDLSDDLYDLFLDAERQYSCALYQTPQDSLEEAQARKMRHIAAKLRLEDGMKVLDIGSGWGGLALSLAKAAGADVTGVTLSVEQQRYAEARAAREGLSNAVRFRLTDYRQQSGRYDRIVSVGMFEHVGAGHYGEYFAKLADLLDDDGVALVHTIGSVGDPAAPHPWIRKYIFPGGYIPSLSEITREIEKSDLILTDLEVLRLHYAETLKAWRERFMANRDKVVEIYDERFCRMWEFYLAACEAGFRHSGLVVFQLQLARKVTTLPMTRDYIATDETRLMTQPGDVVDKSMRRAR